MINGETWSSARVAAGDVGQNTWELWCLDTGGGWFHPIHIHLIDGYLLARNGELAQVRNISAHAQQVRTRQAHCLAL